MNIGSNCLIVGGTGFIGTNICLHLKNKGYQFIVGSKRKSNFEVEFPVLDMKEKWVSYLEDLTEKIDVIWLAGNTVPASTGNTASHEFYQNIFPLTEFLLTAIEKDKIRKFIFLSSGGSVYGDVSEERPIKESIPTNPISLYGLTKIVSEQYIDYYIRNSNAEAVILRPGNVYGPNQNLVKPQGIIGHTFKALIEKRPITIYDAGATIRDYIYVNDVNKAIELVLCSEFEAGSVSTYNLGSGKGYSVLQILELIESITGMIVDKDFEGHRTIDCRFNVLDSSAFKSRYQWDPKIEIEDGLKMVWNWFQQK